MYRAIIDTSYIDTLSSVLNDVQLLGDAGGIGAWLQILYSKREELERQYDRRQLPMHAELTRLRIFLKLLTTRLPLGAPLLMPCGRRENTEHWKKFRNCISKVSHV